MFLSIQALYAFGLEHWIHLYLEELLIYKDWLILPYSLLSVWFCFSFFLSCDFLCELMFSVIVWFYFLLFIFCKSRFLLCDYHEVYTKHLIDITVNFMLIILGRWLHTKSPIILLLPLFVFLRSQLIHFYIVYSGAMVIFNTLGICEYKITLLWIKFSLECLHSLFLIHLRLHWMDFRTSEFAYVTFNYSCKCISVLL